MISLRALFADRRDAGRRLARVLADRGVSQPIVLALPRGGVPVAFEVAVALKAPLDLLFVRKIGAPGHPEFGIGAVVDGQDPQVVMNPEAQSLGVSTAYVEATKTRELEEIERRRRAYLGGRQPLALRDREVIVVDDGIATGGTIRAALRGLAKTGASRIVLAVPVAAGSTIASLEREADEVVCLATPEPFYAVGAFYADFAQTSDAEVTTLLSEARRRTMQEMI